MSYAVQNIENFIVGGILGQYVDEIHICKICPYAPSYIFHAFLDLMRQGLISKEFYENKGHKLLGRYKENNPQIYEKNLDVENDAYQISYILIFQQILVHQGKKYVVSAYPKQVFVGTKKAAKKYAKQMKRILERDKDFQFVSYKIIKNIKE